MQNLVKSSLLLLLALCLGTTIFAQQPSAAQPTTETPAARTPNPNRQTKQLSQKLGLTADQRARVEPILADRDHRIQSLNTNTSLDPKSMRQQRHAITVDTDARLNALLTSAQRQQYATLKAGRRKGGVGAAPIANL